MILLSNAALSPSTSASGTVSSRILAAAFRDNIAEKTQRSEGMEDQKGELYVHKCEDRGSTSRAEWRKARMPSAEGGKAILPPNVALSLHITSHQRNVLLCQRCLAPMMF